MHPGSSPRPGKGGAAAWAALVVLYSLHSAPLSLSSWCSVHRELWGRNLTNLKRVPALLDSRAFIQDEASQRTASAGARAFAGARQQGNSPATSRARATRFLRAAARAHGQSARVLVFVQKTGQLAAVMASLALSQYSRQSAVVPYRSAKSLDRTGSPRGPRLQHCIFKSSFKTSTPHTAQDSSQYGHLSRARYT